MIDGGKAVAGVVLLLLASCTAQPGKPSSLPPPPSPSASHSPSAPSPSASPLDRPHGTDVQQIAALARDYFEESNRAFRTGYTARWRSLITSDCSCLPVILNAERVWREGGAISPKYYNIKRVGTATTQSRKDGSVTVVFTVNKSSYLNKAGMVIQTFPADPRVQSAELDFVKLADTWKVSLVTINS